MAKDTTPRVWVALTVFHKGATLVGLRGPTVNNPNVWNLFGGRIDPNENQYDAATREVREETGLVLTFKPKHMAFSTMVNGRLCVWLEKKLKDHDIPNAKFTREVVDYDFANNTWTNRPDLHYSLKKYLEFKYQGKYKV